MEWSTSLRPWEGVIAGTLVISAVILLKVLRLIPMDVTGILLLFAGGLAAGLMTRGRADDGALAGTACGIIAIAGMVLVIPNVFHLWLPHWAAIGFRILSYAALYIPVNCCAGIGGISIRNSCTGDPFLPEPGDATRTAQRVRWLGIGFGGLLLAGYITPFGTFGLILTLILPGFLAGIIAGLCSGGFWREGYRSGLAAILLGMGLLAIPITWQYAQSPGFATGWGWVLLVLMVFISVPAGIVGGALGGHLMASLTTSPTLS